jgi:hypothetical protein
LECAEFYKQKKEGANELNLAPSEEMNSTNINEYIRKLFEFYQFFANFGFRKRNIYPTLIICEYTNRLWLLN